MGSDWIAGPERADFAGGLVADRKDEIHDWRVGPCEFMPAFAAQTAYRQMKPFEQVEGEGMHHTFWKAAGTVAFEPTFAPMVHQYLGKDASGRVAGAEKRDVVSPFIHGRFCRLWACALR
jgi:hypothetical protein